MKNLSVLFECFELEYPVSMKVFSLISFSMLWWSAFLQVMQYTLSLASSQCIQVHFTAQKVSKCGKMRSRITPNTVIFYAVFIMPRIQIFSWDMKRYLDDLLSILFLYAKHSFRKLLLDFLNLKTFLMVKIFRMLFNRLLSLNWSGNLVTYQLLRPNIKNFYENNRLYIIIRVLHQ